MEALLSSAWSRPVSSIATFLQTESSSGFILIAAALAGLLWANSPWQQSYTDILHAKLGLEVRGIEYGLYVHAWINDAFMAVFFLLVGLEIKRELLVGELSSVRSAALPAIAALGGMLVPALVCYALVSGEPERARGWAIPAATDIAFALAALAVLGSAMPASLKIFMTALAVIDDLGAILLIAVFYTSNLDAVALCWAAGCAVGLLALNRLNVLAITPYLAIGAVMWVFVHQSGVHATIAGVVLALCIPLGTSELRSPLRNLEHRLHPYVAFGIVPLFGLANAGVSFAGLTPAIVLEPLPLGIALGLFAGKQIGILAFARIAIALKIATLPEGMSGGLLWGVSILAGIGFTMSLFIGGLAFQSDTLLTETKVGVFAGSLLSAIAGCAVLAVLSRRARTAPAVS
jgi:NhaA family Na+:H+ antiporter